MSDSPSADEERDSERLAALRAARAAGDDVLAREALAKLIDPYYQVTRTIAFGRLEGVPNREDEATRIAQDVMVRLIVALNKRLDFPMPFHVIVAVNRTYAIKDFWRERFGEEATPHEPTDLVDLDDSAESASTELEQARSFAPYLVGLSALERELVIERIFLDMTPRQSADKHGMKRNAVDQAYHRALKKLRANRPRPDVRNQDEGAA